MSINRKGIFVLSLDTELAWGNFDLGLSETERNDLLNTRACIDRLLALLDKYQIAATFLLVGHLMLDRCDDYTGVKHPGLVRPYFSWYQKDWFSEDPATNLSEAPLWYGIDIVNKIRSAQPKHEIGSHSFSHIIFSDPGCSEACAESDISECIKVAEALGIHLTSFAFPRNYVGHRAILKKYGFKIYRGFGNEWYLRIRNRRLRAAMHMIDEIFRISPGTSALYFDEYGLCNTTGNMLYLSRTGLRRWIPIANRVSKAKKGINRAIRKGQVFHLWFHPYNLASDADGLLNGLDAIFAYARKKIDDGLLVNCTMEQLYAKCAGEACEIR